MAAKTIARESFILGLIREAGNKGICPIQLGGPITIDQVSNLAHRHDMLIENIPGLGNCLIPKTALRGVGIDLETTWLQDAR